MLRNTPNAESVIVEYGFLDNAKDAAKLKANYKKYADAVVKAVLDYKNIPYEQTGYYTVQKGDTLWSIAKKFNLTVDELKDLNNLVNNSLSIGQKLKIETKDQSDSNNNDYYIVQAGDTLFSIARKFGLTVDKIKELNNLTTNNLSIGQKLKVSDELYDEDTYIVEKGDSLYSIAKRYGISVNELKKANNLTSNSLSIGQVLKIPKISTNNDFGYTVQSGDTLYSIASKFGITVNEIKTYNNLTSNNLSIGQTLKIPGNADQMLSDTHTVKTGDTLYSIARMYDTTVSILKELNNLTSDILSVGQTLKVRANNSEIIDEIYDYYTVKTGDTIYSIAQKYNISFEDLKKLNQLTSNNIKVGTLLIIPANNDIIHSVKNGDTLWSIANEYNTTVEKIKEINNLKSNDLYLDQQLLIPNKINNN